MQHVAVLGGGVPTFHLGWSCPLCSDNFIKSSYANVVPRHLECRFRDVLLERDFHGVDGTLTSVLPLLQTMLSDF